MPDPRKIGASNHIVTGNEEIDKGVYVLSFKRKYDFFPGQIVAITLDQNDKEPRLYSICSGNNEDDMSILFNIVPGGKITEAMSELKKGDSIFSSSPYGRFYIGDEPSFWISTGTGIAPFISKLVSDKSTNSILIHGGRAQESFYFSKLLDQTLGSRYIKCSSTLNDKDFYSGRVTKYLLEADKLPVNHRYYLCGRAEMVVESRDILISRGIPFNMIESEIYF